MSKLNQLANIGQSVWYDYIQRSLLESPEFKALIANGLRGITSNPSIFEKAIAGTTDYDTTLAELSGSKNVNDIYETLVIQDIGRAADLFRPLFDATNGLDGYVSIEVNPLLAYDGQRTIEEAIRLFNELKRPNIMIKVPGTDQGLPAVTELLSLGINVNVTLIFGVAQYRKVAAAFLDGVEKYHQSKGDVSKVDSVASFFVSRVDSAIDEQLKSIGNSELLGKIAVANSKAAYAEAQSFFDQTRWTRLAKEGARPQRLLWASTGTKNPDYSDTLYVDELIGPDTVNTMPPATLDAFLDHGTVSSTIDQDFELAKSELNQLAELGINLDETTGELLRQGVQQFENAFHSLIKTVEDKVGSK
jgi:transaldolase